MNIKAATFRRDLLFILYNRQSRQLVYNKCEKHSKFVKGPMGLTFLELATNITVIFQAMTNKKVSLKGGD